MRRLILAAVSAAFLLSLFSPTAFALQWDPKNPPKYPHKPALRENKETDDGSWVDPPTKSSGGVLWLSFEVILRYLHLDLSNTSVTDQNEEQRDEANGPEIIESRGTGSEQAVR